MTYSDENALHALIYKDESFAKSFVFCSSNSCNVKRMVQYYEMHQMVLLVNPLITIGRCDDL